MLESSEDERMEKRVKAKGERFMNGALPVLLALQKKGSDDGCLQLFFLVDFVLRWSGN